MRTEDLFGAWHLVSFTSLSPDGDVTEPYGADPLGMICYTPSGHVSAQLCRADRGDFGTKALESAAQAPDAAKLRAFDGYTSYAGRYEFQDGVVSHHVELCLVPSLVGTTLRRGAELTGDQLALSYSYRNRGNTLIWRR